jgi:hypothetical protein
MVNRKPKRLYIAILILAVLFLKGRYVSCASETSYPQRAGSGYKFIGRNILTEAGIKYDGQPIWTYGTIRFANGIALLGNDNAAGPDAVCLQTLRQQVAVLRQLTSLGVGVWGIYHRTAKEAHKNCQNGTIIVQSVEISFE